MSDARPTNGDGNRDWLARDVAQLYPQLVKWRRDFHRFPEPGWTEYRTTARIVYCLREWGWRVYLGDDVTRADKRMGVPAESVLRASEERALGAGVSAELLAAMRGGKTGVVAEWATGVPGPVIAFRFDIDSNDVAEATDETHRPTAERFSSEYADCMHACGHDGHAAIGLGVARLVAQYANRWKGTIRLLFQPAEEGGRGALAMVRKGWLDDVDVFLSGHIGFRSDTLGEVVLNAHGFYVTTKWDAAYAGRAAHAGGNPELGKNALLAAATAALNLHAIPRHSGGASRVNVGTLYAGTGRNVVPAEAHMALEVRGEDDTVHRFLDEETVRILRAAGDMYDVGLTLDKVGSAGQAEGDAALIEQLRPLWQGVSDVHTVRDSVVFGASEDATHMMQRVQQRGGMASYMLFGTPLAAQHHQSTFDFDERVLRVAVEGYVRTLTMFLQE
ncbi:amidohydrolase [Numidum massiliense]|uniref:amidohydrolase n=1 Tax=Numidum massiliense TaxID=1522315 RepID=UPI0006D5784F|nr:amidohydrolase [Numidum massiliense]